MPTMLALLKSMYARFQTNIADAQKLEANADVRVGVSQRTACQSREACFHGVLLLFRVVYSGGESTKSRRRIIVSVIRTPFCKTLWYKAAAV